MIIATAGDSKWRDSWVIFVLSFMRQFGFQREVNAGERVRLGAMILLGLLHVMFVILVCFAVESRLDKLSRRLC